MKPALVATLAFWGFLSLDCLADAQIKSNYASGMVLTSDELATVLSIAQLAGVTNIDRVATGYVFLSPDRGVFLSENETVTNRTVRYRTLFVKRRQWMRASERISANSIQVGDFWLVRTEMVQLTVLRVDGREFRVSRLADDLPIATAETILGKLLRGEYDFPKMEDGRKDSGLPLTHLDEVDFTKPFQIQCDSAKQLFSVSFGAKKEGGPTFILKVRAEGSRLHVQHFDCYQM